MITQAERQFIREHAYVPEHVPEYVSAISGAEAYLADDFLSYVSAEALIFIGYPLKGSPGTKVFEKCFRRALKRYLPKRVNVIGPDAPSTIPDNSSVSYDHYYRLEVKGSKVSQKLRNTLSRASRELAVVKSVHFGEEHALIIAEFLAHHRISEATRSIFARIPDYLRASQSAILFEARSPEGALVALDVVESGARDYLFYLFNFSSRQRYVPGGSDLLMKEMIGEADAQEKKFVNMGLGIDPGITFFKTKWGGQPFLRYTWCRYTISREESMTTLLDKL